MSKLWNMDTINKTLTRPGDEPLHEEPVARTPRQAGTLTDQSQTVINAKLTGSLAIEETDDGTSLVLHGQLEGDLTCDSISIVESGSMDGTLKANYVTISGRYSGTVDSEHLTIKPGAIVRGELHVRRSVVIEPDADFQGKLISAEDDSSGSGARRPEAKKLNGGPSIYEVAEEMPVDTIDGGDGENAAAE